MNFSPKTLFNILTFILVILGCEKDVVPNVTENAELKNFTISVDDLDREYAVYIPAGYTAKEKWPVVFNMHYHGGETETLRQVTQLYKVADTAKFLVVYPVGLPVKILYLNSTRNGWYVPDHYEAIENQDDVKFIELIINDLILNPDINIDQNRIHVAGTSIGAAFAFYLAFELSDKIASVAGVAGQMSDKLINELATPKRPISVMHVQGTEDSVYPENGNSYCLSLKGVTEYWAEVANCRSMPEMIDLEDIDTTDECTATCYSYVECSTNIEVLLYQINGGGHNYPGGDHSVIPQDVGVINMDINTSAEIWKFFKRNPRPL